MQKTNLILAAVFTIVVFSGCSAQKQTPTGFLSSYSKLEAESESSLRYLNKAALPSYSSFIVDRVEVHFQDGAKAIKEKSKGKLTEKDMADLTNYFHAAIAGAIQKAGYRVVWQPGPGVARLRVAITDMEETNVILAAIPQTRMITGAGVGGASMEVEVVDSLTGRQIAAVIETKAGSRIPFTGLSEWGGAKSAINAWAKRLEKRLTEAKAN